MVTDSTYDVLLIGGGIAAASAAHELRERGFEGSILLVTREQDPPYHRPPITKGYLRGGDTRASTLVHPEDWYAEHDVELRTRTPVMSVDCAAQTAKVGKEVVSFGQALFATGAMVRRLRTDGATRSNIHYLRALGNADTLREAVADAERVVVVGGSYIATEVAASLTELGKRCTLVMQEALPVERGFGPVAGRFVHDLLDGARRRDRRRGRRRRVRRRGRRRGPVRRRRLRRRAAREGDLVVVGSGALPDVMLARKSGLVIGDTGGVACNQRLRTSEPDIYAAGDMCEFDSVAPRPAAADRARGGRRGAGPPRRAGDARLRRALRRRPVLLVGPRRLGDARVRRQRERRLGRGDRPRRPGERRVQRLVSAGRRARRDAGGRPHRRHRARRRADRRPTASAERVRGALAGL